MNIADLLLSRGNDSAEAVCFGNSVLTYGDLREKVNGLSASLLHRGHPKGDRIGLFSENSPFFIVAYLATLRAGLVAVPFQVESSPATFENIVASTGMCEVFVSDRYLPTVGPWADKLGLTILSEANLGQLATNGAELMPEVDEYRDLAALMFTSGSTGEPKGVMVTHRNIECNTRDIIQYMGLNSDDRVMVVLPFHYCFGASLLHTLLMAGGSMVLNNDSRLYPEAMLQEMRQKECTGLAGVPSTYQLLLRKSRFRQLTFPNLRWFQQAGGRLPNPFVQELVTAFPHIRYFAMYGQTEASARLSFLPPERLPHKLGSIGKGLPSTSLEVLKADGTPVVPGSAEVGEIVAMGENIALGYWKDPEETAKYFKNGRLHTGDLARVDSEGFIFIVDREREMIKSGGYRVSAKEVEDVIAELPEVLEVAVFGMPHDLLGEAIQACVVTSKGMSLEPEIVKRQCRRRLSPFKVPESVVFLPTLPHNSSGKILRPKLREMLLNRRPAPEPATTLSGVSALANQTVGK